MFKAKLAAYDDYYNQERKTGWLKLFATVFLPICMAAKVIALLWTGATSAAMSVSVAISLIEFAVLTFCWAALLFADKLAWIFLSASHGVFVLTALYLIVTSFAGMTGAAMGTPPEAAKLAAVAAAGDAIEVAAQTSGGGFSVMKLLMGIGGVVLLAAYVFNYLYMYRRRDFFLQPADRFELAE